MLDEDVTRQTAPAVCLRPTAPCFHYTGARVVVDEFGCSSFSALHDKLVSAWPISCPCAGSSFGRPPGVLALLSCSHFTLFNEPGPGSCRVVLSGVLLNLHAAVWLSPSLGSLCLARRWLGHGCPGSCPFMPPASSHPAEKEGAQPSLFPQRLHQACSPGSELDRPALGFPGSGSLPTPHCPWGCFIGRDLAWALRAH